MWWQRRTAKSRVPADRLPFVFDPPTPTTGVRTMLRCSITVAVLAAVLLDPGRVASAEEELSSVTGRVTLDGKPLGTGKVIFHIGDGQFVGSKIGPEGEFKVGRVPKGTHKVTVEAIINGRNVLPPVYSSEERSELRFEVKKGENVLDLQLKSR
jgi:hypothetical protein